MNAINYQDDFYGWTQEQAQLLKNKKINALDIKHLIEELESMGAREKRELLSRLRVLLMHLLKWKYQLSLRSRSWELTIRNERDELDIHLSDNPSLKHQLETIIVNAYRLARRDAEKETGISEKTFPKSCPWLFDKIIDAKFFPH